MSATRLKGDREMNLEQRAREFATKAHEGQHRKYTGEPYIAHPEAVAELVRTVPHSDHMLAAAWLHDTVEDTDTMLLEILEVFGSDVAVLVEGLTDISRPSDGNRAVRKAIDREHTSRAVWAAKTIKLADLIDNSRSITAHDPQFAKVYMKEKALLLDVLTEGDQKLLGIARGIVDSHNEGKQST